MPLTTVFNRAGGKGGDMKLSVIISYYKVLIIAIVCSALAACQTLPSVHVLRNESADFSRYETFSFHPNLAVRGDEYDKLYVRYIKTAIMHEMQKRGYRYAEEADLWVNFNTNVEDKIWVSDLPSASFYYSYRRGYYDVWGNYPFYPSRIEQYTEGTLNIDIIDRRENQLLWEGVAIGRLSKNMYENLEFRIYQTVELIFNQYP